MIKKERIEIFLLILIIFVGFFFRFNNLNWDENFHLHPDERFLTMVGNSMKISSSFSTYFNQSESAVNPYNLGYDFFVYGSFPLILNKYLAVFLNKDTYNDFTILGRILSGFFDLLIIILVYKTTKLLIEKKILSFRFLRLNFYFPLFCSLFYAISVYPIQSSHFFTVDTFLNFFMFGSFYFVLKSYLFSKHVSRSTFYIILSAVFFGLALSSKISALYILPLNLGLLLLSFLEKKETFLSKIKGFLIFTIYHLLFIYLTLRLANPYYFQNPSFFDMTLNKDFVRSIQSLTNLSTKEAWYPPGVQWINKPWWGFLSTTFFAGLGPVNFIVMVVGIIFLISNIKYQISNIHSKYKKYKIIIIFLILLWVIGYSVYQSFQFVKSIRYTIYLYPFFAIFGGIGMSVIGYWLLEKKLLKTKYSSTF